MTQTYTIAIANDHAGVDMKNALVAHLQSMGHTVKNLGTDSLDSVDYPDFAGAVADAIAGGDADYGVLLCGTGIGISIAANRHKHIRAALCQSALEARLTREHNNANVLVMGARIMGMEKALDCIDTFFTTDYEGGRHQRRVDKMS